MVQIEGMDKLIREHPSFKELSEEHLQLLAGCCANERFADNEYIARQDMVSEKFYLIRHGRVALELHPPGMEPLILETLEAGDIVGWSWLIAPYKWAFDVRSVGLSRLISLDAVCLRGKLETDHELGYRLMSNFIPIIVARLNAVRIRLLDLYGHPGNRK